MGFSGRDTATKSTSSSGVSNTFSTAMLIEELVVWLLKRGFIWAMPLTENIIRT